MVDIVVGQVTVPDVENTDQASAESALTDQYLAVDYAASQYSATIAVGKIISQSPTAGTDVDPGSTVTLTVSLGANITPHASGYTITVTPVADGLIRAVALRRGSAPPSAVQIAAGRGADNAPADGASSITGTTGIDVDVVLSGLTLPKYDLYLVDAEDTVSALTNQLKSPPTGRQYTVVDLS